MNKVMNLYDIRDFNWNGKYRLFSANSKDLIPSVVNGEDNTFVEKIEIINPETGNLRQFTYEGLETEFIPAYAIDPSFGEEERPLEIQFLVYVNREDNLSCQIYLNEQEVWSI